MILCDLPHDTADAGDGADGEEESDAEFLGYRHFDLVEDNERNGKEGEIERNMNYAEGDACGIRIYALWWGFERAESVQVEVDAYGVDADENVKADGDKEVADQEAEEYVVSDHPPLRRETRESTVEKRYGDLDESDRKPEDKLANPGKLDSNVSAI